MNRRNLMRGLAVLVAFFATAYAVAGIEHLVGVACGLAKCGPDELPFVSGVAVAFLVAVVLFDE